MDEEHFVCLRLVSDNFKGEVSCTVPVGAVYADIVAAVRERLRLKDDTAVELRNANDEFMTLGEEMDDTDLVRVNYSAAKAGGRPPLAQTTTMSAASAGDRSRPSGAYGASRSAGAAAGAGGGSGAGNAYAGAGTINTVRSMSADEDPTRTLSPSERVTSATWLKAVASMDDGQQSLRDVLGVKALDEEPELPDDLEADVHGRARVYLKSLGLTYPELGRLLTSRYAGAALAAVARMCNALSNAIANHENLSKVRSHAHRVVVVLVSCKAPASATLPVSQNGRLQDLDKVSKALTKYVEFYTDVGFLRKHLTGAEFKETVGTYVVRAVSDLQDIAKADGKSDSAVAKIGSYSDLALIDTSKLDSIVARHRHERATLVQAVSQPSAVETMSGDAAPELLVRDRGSDAVVADAPKGHHYVVMFNHDGALQQVNITCRDLDDRWLFDMEPRTVSSEVVSVVGPAGKPFSLGSPLYDLLDHLLHAVEEIEHKYTSDKDFLEQAMQAE